MAKQIMLELPVALTQAEMAARGESVGHMRAELNKLTAKAATVAKEFKLEISRIDNEIERLASILRNRAEPRPVACVLNKNLSARKMETIRTDTGEVVRTRALEDHELNGELFEEPFVEEPMVPVPIGTHEEAE